MVENEVGIMRKIVLLPLDERPCNYEFPYKLFHDNKDIEIIRPEKLGDKKIAANQEEIEAFLLESCKEADGLVISMDTLLYGGLIPSRLHHHSDLELDRRLSVIKQIKDLNHSLKIYAFQCIMRCPKYSSDDEEPDYYEICGAEIHKLGQLIHKEKLGIGNEEEKKELEAIVKKEYLDDYVNRRNQNISFNLKTLDYLKEGIIDFLVIPQDDSAKYGFTAMDQEVVRNKISKDLLQDLVLMYPGADEVAMTLLARITNEMNGKVPKVYVKYASIHAPFLIPAYEDRSLGETIKYHILASGCMMTDSVAESDFVLAVSAPANEMLEASQQPARNMNYEVERNITEFVTYIEQLIKEGKAVSIGDNAFANGADLELIALLNKRSLLLKVAGYAGWNTSSNTLGTSIAQGVLYLYRGDTVQYRDFLVERYIEDAGYCAQVRSYVTSNKLADLGMNYFDVQEKQGIVSDMVRKLLIDFVETKLSSIANHVEITQVAMPWKRMFEVDLHARYKSLTN